jgi:hypothetical protein
MFKITLDGLVASILLIDRPVLVPLIVIDCPTERSIALEHVTTLVEPGAEHVVLPLFGVPVVPLAVTTCIEYRLPVDVCQ